MAISSCHDQIRTVILRQANEVTRVGFGRVDANIGVAFHTVILQIFGDVANTPPRRILFV